MTDLKITQQATEDHQILLTIEVPDARVEKAMRIEAKKLARQFRFPGFRPGKAPYHVVVARVGRDAILEEVADQIGQDVYREALEAIDLTPYDRAELREVTYDPLTYLIATPLKPTTDPGDYRSLRVPFEEPSAEAIEAEVQEQIEQILSQYKTWTPVERPVEYGDMVTISMRATVDEEEILNNEDWDIVPNEEDPTLSPDFDAAFIGMNAGETKHFTIDFAEDSETPWAGEQAVFDVEVLGVKSHELPEPSDELAQEVGDFETWEALEQDIREFVVSKLRREAEKEYHDKVFDAAIEQATIVYPPAAVKRQIDMTLQQRTELFRAYGIESKEDLFSIMGRSEEEYREELRPSAEHQLKHDLLLKAIAEAEQFPVSEYELVQYLETVLSDSESEVNELLEAMASDEAYRDFVVGLVQQAKAHELLLAIAKGEDVPEPGEHVAEEAPPEPEIAEEEASLEEDDAVEITAEAEALTAPQAGDEETLESEAPSHPQAKTEGTLDTTDESEAAA